MFTRLATNQNYSFFLFGPRGTGKSTWLKSTIVAEKTYDLLSTREVLRLSRDPSILYDELVHLPRGSWIIIDEIQKVPALLSEVHRLIEDRGLLFALSGSSARKLRKGGVNLLAGRAHTLNFFSLVSAELQQDYDVKKALSVGTLPLAVTSVDPQLFLSSYVDTYLEQEIKAEALVKDIGSFARFLEVAARQAGQVTNTTNISRDAMVARQTVQSYFEILVDTLVGFWLPAWKLKRATKQVLQPKFYFFDTGVVRAINHRLSFPLFQEEMGVLLEMHILNELRAYLNYHRLDYPLYFWSSHDQVEVDIFCETPKGYVGIEIKSSNTWRPQYSRGLSRLTDELRPQVFSPTGVYLGQVFLQTFHPIYPVQQFLKKLWAGEIL